MNEFGNINKVYYFNEKIYIFYNVWIIGHQLIFLLDCRFFLTRFLLRRYKNGIKTR